MGHRTERHQEAAERTVKDIRRKTRKRYSSEEKIRIVLAGPRGGAVHSIKSGRRWREALSLTHDTPKSSDDSQSANDNGLLGVSFVVRPLSC